ncbi:MAG TPA: PEGA domain-containing protein [Polyangiaceae bacterium]|nr:PEGA domain-containing protein [Polyangiaceae bacterium]
MMDPWFRGWRHSSGRVVHGVGKLITLSTLVGLLLTLWAARAEAAPPGPDALPVHVVAVKSLEALDQAQALTNALKKAVRDSEGWSLGDSNQSLEFLAIQMKCAEPIDAACEARIADQLKADRYLWAVIEFDPGDKQFVAGKLNFFVRGKGTSSVDLRYSANLTDPNDDSLLELVKARVNEVTGGAPRGTLKVSTGGVSGQLFVDGEPVGAVSEEGASYPLPAGEHRIVVKAPGYADAEANVVVKPAATVETTLTMVEVAEDKPVDWRMITGFGLVGVSVASGAVGLWASLQVNQVRNDETYKNFQAATFKSAGDACQAAETGASGLGTAYNDGSEPGPTATVQDANDTATLCSKAANGELMQAVMFPLAAVSAGVGFYLLGTSSLFGGGDDADAASAITVTPLVGPGGGAVTLTYAF